MSAVLIPHRDLYGRPTTVLSNHIQFAIPQRRTVHLPQSPVGRMFDRVWSELDGMRVDWAIEKMLSARRKGFGLVCAIWFENAGVCTPYYIADTDPA